MSVPPSFNDEEDSGIMEWIQEFYVSNSVEAVTVIILFLFYTILNTIKTSLNKSNFGIDSIIKKFNKPSEDKEIGFGVDFGFNRSEIYSLQTSLIQLKSKLGSDCIMLLYSYERETFNNLNICCKISPMLCVGNIPGLDNVYKSLTDAPVCLFNPVHNLFSDIGYIVDDDNEHLLYIKNSPENTLGAVLLGLNNDIEDVQYGFIIYPIKNMRDNLSTPIGYIIIFYDSNKYNNHDTMKFSEFEDILNDLIFTLSLPDGRS